jgi:phenylpropionate dioxygenase-like ring-hydroxylating dioxygenase large terminal subunit
VLNQLNQKTQPLKKMKVFNNEDVIPEGWYCVGRVSDLESNKKILQADIGKQKIIIFRSSKGDLHCLDAFCPHMGLNLGLGEVKGNHLRCSFHHWEFDGKGEIASFPCESRKPNVKLNSYPIVEKFGHLWVWPDSQIEATYAMPDHFTFEDGEIDILLGKGYARPSHFHISLINALDLQHVNTVHALEMEVNSQVQVAIDKSYIHYDFQTKFKKDSRKGRMSGLITGGGYEYSVRYYSGTIGFLRALDKIKLFKKIPFPSIYGVFGYCPQSDGSTKIYPIFITKKRRGLGKIISFFNLQMTQMIYTNLKNEDGEIYENIRFSPTFVAEDSNITKFIAYINDLKSSLFSV